MGEWKFIFIFGLEPEEGKDIHLDTRDFKYRQVTLENRVESNDEDCIIKKDEIKSFIARFRSVSTPDNMLWWKHSNLKYIWFVSQGDAWVVTDRYMNPIKWKGIIL